MRNRIVKTAALMLCLALILTGCNMIRPNQERINNKPVAQVNDTIIPKGEVQQTYDYYKSMYEYYNSMYGYAVYDVSSLPEQVIDAFVTQELIRQHAADMGIDPDSEENKATITAAAQEQFDASVEEELASGHIDTEGMTDEEARAAAEAHLAEDGVTLDTLIENERESFIADAVREEIIKTVEVTDEDVETAFAEKVESDAAALGESTSLVEMYGANGTAVYWYPAGYRTVKHVLLQMNDEQTAALTPLNTVVTNVNNAINTVKADMSEEDIAAAEAEVADQISQIQAEADERIAQLNAEAEAAKAAAAETADETAAETTDEAADETATETTDETATETADEAATETENTDDAVEAAATEETTETETAAETTDEATETEAAAETTEEATETEAATEETTEETTEATEETIEAEEAEDLTALSLSELLVRQAQAEADVRVKKAEIMIEMTDRIDEVYAALESGRDFDDVMAEFGEDPGMKSEPAMTTGYYVAERSTYWEDAFKQTAMALENVGDVSEPVMGSRGVHIIYYNSDVPEGAIDIETVREDLTATTLKNKQDEAYDAALDAWHNEAKIKTWPERLDT